MRNRLLSELTEAPSAEGRVGQAQGGTRRRVGFAPSSRSMSLLPEWAGPLSGPANAFGSSVERCGRAYG